MIIYRYVAFYLLLNDIESKNTKEIPKSKEALEDLDEFMNI